MKKLGQICLLGVLAVGATSCGENSWLGKKSGKKISETNPSLMGTWETNCHGEDGLLDAAYTVKSYRFTPTGDFVKTETYYKDDRCTEKLLSYEAEGSTADLDNRSDKKTRDFNLTVNEQAVTVYNDTAIKFLNTTEVCGKDDWTLNEKVQLEGKKCAGHAFENGSVIFDIYRKEDDSMYFGKVALFNSKDKADNRPSELDRSQPFVKK